MNKKLLFAAMSLVALTACTNDEFQSKQQLAEETGSVKFEVINNAFTRASMNGNSIVWNANDGDLFTLYHGSTVAGWKTGYENATYTAEANEGGTATLSTPSMIKPGSAIMVWPVDSTFRYNAAGQLTLKIPAEIKDIENNIPYVSDLINIGAYSPAGAYNEAGLNRTYPVYMRPMGSQLTLKADYAGTDALVATLYTIDDPIEPIKVTSMSLLTRDDGTPGTTDFTTEIGLQFSGVMNPAWNAPAPTAVPNNAWIEETQFDLATIPGKTNKLTAKDNCLNGNESCKFIILPQVAIPAAGVDCGGIVVNTIYGKVVIANAGDADNHGTAYTNVVGGEIEDAWYRYVTNPLALGALVPGETAAATPEASGEHAGKYLVTSEPKIGMRQAINALSTATVSSTTSPVQNEQVGAATTRYIKVLLNHLDMSDLHIQKDKQLRDAVRVWQKMNLPSVTVYVDGDAVNGVFVMSQKTIETINAINAANLAAGTGRIFTIKPCKVAGEACDEIIVTGGGKIQDMAFIMINNDAVPAVPATKKADVVLQAMENWEWDGTITVNTAANTGINSIINRGTLTNAEDKILDIVDFLGADNNILVKNDVPGKWNITTGAKIRVQNDVENLGTLTIGGEKDNKAQYLMDGATFTNNALTLEKRFNGGVEQIGKVWNYGVFATINGGIIDNLSLIEHAAEDAKTYVTTNELAGNFAAAFNPGANMMGRINLPWSNKLEDNVSVSAALAEGFVSVTIDGEAKGALDAGAVGNKVNYVIVKSGPTSIANLAGQVEYLEIAMESGKELAWSVPGIKNFTGLIVLSDVNIKLGTTVNVSDATYLDANAFMYVGGITNITNVDCSGYYGNTNANYDTNYITY